MAITTTEQTAIMKTVSALFNKAFTPETTTKFFNFYESNGKDLSKLADGLIGSASYEALYAGAGTIAEYGAILMAKYNMTYGGTSDADTKMTNFIKYSFDHAADNNSLRTIQAVDKYITATLLPSVTTGNVFETMNTAIANKAEVAITFKNDSANAGKELSLVSVTADPATKDTANSSVNAGSTYTLTSSADTLTTDSVTAALKTTAGDDIFRAPTDGMLDTADYIDAGAGNDTLTASITAASQTIAPVLKNLENITLTITAADMKTTTFNAADVTGVSTLTIKDAGAVSMSGSDELISVTNLAKTATLGIIGGTASTGTTASEITATFASAAAADTQKVAISTLGKVGVLTLSTAETVEITATGTGTTGANTIGSLAATAAKTLNIKGSGDLTIAASNMNAIVTVNASTSSGVISFTGETAATSTTFTGGTGATTVNTASTGTVTITTGAGNDTIDFLAAANTATVSTGAGDDSVNVGASSNVTAADSINGGDGTDTIIVSDTTINATTKTALALGVSNFEYLGASATAELSIDFVALSTYNTVVVSGASGATAAVADTAGNASINVTKMENTDALVIAAARVGQAGGADGSDSDNNGANGGNGLTLTPSVDGGANAATLKLIGNADITGGVGGVSASGAGTSGNGGTGISASTIEALNIEIAGTQISTGTADTVTIAGGALGAANGSGSTAGSAGSDIIVGTNATITLTDSLFGATAALYNNVDLGTVVGTNVTVNASAMHGNVTVTAASGNVTLTGGAGNDTLTGGTGTDTINGGAGNDIIDAGNGADILSGGTGRDSFVISVAADSDTTNYNTISDFGKVTAATSVAQTAAMTNTAAFQATATSFGGANADMLDMATTATLAAAATGTNVAASIGGGTLTADISAKGVITVQGASLANLDTLAEWVSIANTMAGTNGNVAVFEYDGNTYVFQQDSGAGDDLVQLTGVTGVTGITLVASSVAAAAGDIFVI